MSQKVNPIAVRLRFNRRSDSSWFSDYYYSTLLYQDLNFREYLSSIRQPNANKLGFRVAKCVIHQFPKRSLIHLFCLGRPKAAASVPIVGRDSSTTARRSRVGGRLDVRFDRKRGGGSLEVRNLAKSTPLRASISQKKKALASYVRQSYNFSKAALAGPLRAASFGPNARSVLRTSNDPLSKGAQQGTQWFEESRVQRSHFLANLLELHKVAQQSVQRFRLGTSEARKRARQRAQQGPQVHFRRAQQGPFRSPKEWSQNERSLLRTLGAKHRSRVSGAQLETNARSPLRACVGSTERAQLCLRRVNQLLRSSGFTSGTLVVPKARSVGLRTFAPNVRSKSGRAAVRSTAGQQGTLVGTAVPQINGARAQRAQLGAKHSGRWESGESGFGPATFFDHSSNVSGSSNARQRCATYRGVRSTNFESSGEVRITQLAKSTRLKSLVGALAFNYYAMHYFFLKKTNSIYEIASHHAQARRVLTCFAPLTRPLESINKTPRFAPLINSSLTHVSGASAATAARVRRRLTSCRYFYLSNVQSILSDKTRHAVSIRPIKVSSIFQSASLIAQEIACKLEQKKSFRQICRSIFQQISNCKYIKGIRISCSGRLNGAEIAKTECRKYGETSLHVFSDKIDYAQTKASTAYGILGVKVWISYV